MSFKDIYPLTITTNNGVTINDAMSLQVLTPSSTLSSISTIFDGSIFSEGYNEITLYDIDHNFKLTELTGGDNRVLRTTILNKMYDTYYILLKEFIRFQYVPSDLFSLELNPDENEIVVSHKYVTDDYDTNHSVTLKLLKEQMIEAIRQKYLLEGRYTPNSVSYNDLFFFIYPTSQVAK